MVAQAHMAFQVQKVVPWLLVAPCHYKPTYHLPFGGRTEWSVGRERQNNLVVARTSMAGTLVHKSHVLGCGITVCQKAGSDVKDGESAGIG